jgi:hypothetical protein
MGQGLGSVYASPRMRGEVGLRSNPGEGAVAVLLSADPDAHHTMPLIPALSPQAGRGREGVVGHWSFLP